MRKVEPLPNRDCEAGYGPEGKNMLALNKSIVAVLFGTQLPLLLFTSTSGFQVITNMYLRAPK